MEGDKKPAGGRRDLATVEARAEQGEGDYISSKQREKEGGIDTRDNGRTGSQKHRTHEAHRRRSGNERACVPYADKLVSSSYTASGFPTMVAICAAVPPAPAPPMLPQAFFAVGGAPCSGVTTVLEATAPREPEEF